MWFENTDAKLKNHGGHWEHGEFKESFIIKNLLPSSKALVIPVFPLVS